MTKPGWASGAGQGDGYTPPRRWETQMALGGVTYVPQADADTRVNELLTALRAAEAELASIDAVLARRPALDLPTRRENIEKAISVAKRCDEAEARLQAIDDACAEVCPDNTPRAVGTPDQDVGRYVCQGEDGGALIDTDDPAEVVRELSRLWALTQERAEKAEARAEANAKDAERYAYCRQGAWLRRMDPVGWDATTDTEQHEERTYLEVRVPNGSNLSCRAMVDEAIDRARAQEVDRG